MARPAHRARRQAQGAGLLLTAAFAACAKIEPPPGGPPDAAPPIVVSVRPESGAVVPQWRDDVVIRFDEVIEEMPQTLAGHVILSPVAGDVEVSWARTAIRVKPKEGWQRDRVYRLELLPGIVDLRRNRLDSGRVVIFSTGPDLPSASLSGTALHWTEQRALVRALVQAVRRPDTVPYVVFADSSGDFALGGIPPGDYVVYAVADQNANRRRDGREAYDSAPVRVDSSATVVLWAFPHDTTGPRLREAEPVDSLTFRVAFTQHLDPFAPVDSSHVRLFALPDTTPVALAAVLAPAVYDSLRRREQAAADSLRRAQADTVPADTGAARRPPAPPPAPPAADTSRARQLLGQRPSPVDRLLIRTAEPLRPDARYLVRVSGLRNLMGAAGEGQLVLVTPKPPARDTTRAP